MPDCRQAGFCPPCHIFEISTNDIVCKKKAAYIREISKKCVIPAAAGPLVVRAYARVVIVHLFNAKQGECLYSS